MNIRRYYYPNQIVFITQIVKDRKPIFFNDSSINLLKETLKNVKTHYPFSMIAYVYLPDHFHLLIRPVGQVNFSQIMHSLKSNFTRQYKNQQRMKDNVNFWQKRFWDHVIRNEVDLENHIHYIHYNPVKHGYVNEMRTWNHSSFITWQKRGLYEKNEKWVEPQNLNWGE